MRIVLVANPESGGGTDADAVAAGLRAHGADVLLAGRQELDAARLAGSDRLVAAGGDGTLGRAADAAVAAGIPLAVVPTGTANDFARAVGLPLERDRAIALAADPAAPERRLDVGRADGRAFLNAVSAGLSPRAAHHAAGLKRLLGPLAYALGALRAGLTARPLECAVRQGGREEWSGAVWQVTVASTGAFGGGSAVGELDVEDGVLDVAVVPAGPRRRLVTVAWAMRRRALAAHPAVTHLRGRAFELVLPPGTPLNLDGELVAGGRTAFSVEPRALRLVGPSGPG